MDRQTQQVKLQLLQSLMDHLDKLGADDLESKFKPKMSVEVAAPDKEGLAEGLEHAKDIADSPELEGLSSESPDSDDDEQGLLALLAKDDDEDEHEPLGNLFHR